MRRSILVASLFATAAAITSSGTVVSVPMDAVGTFDFQGALIPKASPAATQRAVAGKGEETPRLGSASAADGIAAGRPASISAVSRGRTKAGATAQRYGEPAPVGRDFRRHRAPFSLFAIVVTTAGQRGIPVHILAGLAEDESSWRSSARGRHGELGLLQLKPAIARWCGGINRLDAAENADCGARYLLAQFERFGSWELALAAYKAGPSTVPENIPADSWAFVRRTLAKAEDYR